MNNKTFNINSFNILEDTDNYYFFRALNLADNTDISTGKILDENGSIINIRTDRERFIGEPKYSQDDKISLEEVFDHIKMHHRTDTNCISLSSNANVSVLYGRKFYKDKYVLIKVSKKELGNIVFNAGEYMIDEIEKAINDLIQSGSVNERIQKLLKQIDGAGSKEELDNIVSLYNTSDVEETGIFEKGIIKEAKITSVEYNALNEEQNLAKNKIIAKIMVINKNIIPTTSNKLLIQTLGNAFSSLELLHYGEISKDKIIELPKEYTDMFALIQQLPINFAMARELKQELINILSNNPINIPEFSYQNDILIDEKDYTIENMFNVTNGSISFNDVINLYKKSYYLAKSRMRTISLCESFSRAINKQKYNAIFEYMKKYTFVVEPEIFFKKSGNSLQVSESVSLDFSLKERELFEYVNYLSESDLSFILNNTNDALKYFLSHFKRIEKTTQDKETYYANAIIDVFDWSRIGVVSFTNKHKTKLINKLKEYGCVNLYEKLKSQGVLEKNIANVLLTTVIKNKSITDIDIKDTFTSDDLDDYLGYYKVNGTKGLKLKSYQARALKNIDKIFANNRFAVSVLPTGAGKSFVSLAEMLEHKNDDILYLAPNDTILEQIKSYIVEYIHGDTTKMTTSQIVKSVFPKLKLKTYQSVLMDKNKRIINKDYDLIIFDELHRTGAVEWNKQVNELIENQSENTRFLGITATPQRDVDLKNMADEWARKFGYSEKDIIKRKHMASNMDLLEAISLGYVVNPRIVNCEYTLESDGSLNRMLELINSITDEKEKNRLLQKYDSLRKRVDNAEGIGEILRKNTKIGGKYIVFCPVTNKDDKELETIDGYDADLKLSSSTVVNYYISELLKYFDKEEVEFYDMLGDYSDKQNQNNLEKFENDTSSKIKFMVVMNKLNEGCHAKVDGLIWFRPLDENSNILYHQQLGRIIYALDSKTNNEERPIAIDLVNNTYRINMNKTEKQSISDIDKLKNIIDWINEHSMYELLYGNGKTESKYRKSLKGIQEKYAIYLNNEKLQGSNNKEEIETVLDLGNSIDLWNISIPEAVNDSNNIIDIDDIFYVSEILHDYYELQDDINDSSSIFNARMNELVEWFKSEDNQRMFYSKKDFFKDGTNIYDYVRPKKEKILIERPDVAELIKKYNSGFFENMKQYDLLFETRMDELIEWLKDNKKMFKTDGDCFKDGVGIYGYVNQRKKSILTERPDVAELIKKYNPVFFEDTTQFDLLFKTRMDELVEWFKDNKKMFKWQGDCFKDGVEIYGYVNQRQKRILKERPDVVELIKQYNQFFFERASHNNDVFKSHMDELVKWLRENKKMVSVSDKYKDGSFIYSNIKLCKKRILVERPDVAELIKQYNPVFFEDLSYNDYKFKTRMEELVEWFKDNKKMFQSGKDFFKDNQEIYSYIRKRKKRVFIEYPNIVELIEQYDPKFFTQTRKLIETEQEFETDSTFKKAKSSKKRKEGASL